MPFVRPNDITMHYDFTGPHDAPVVMLMNSLGTGVHLWDEQVNALTRVHRVLRYDMRGHGLTDATASDDPALATVEQLAADAIALLDALGVQRVDLAGLSIGGMVAQRVAARYPARVRKLALCATASRIGPPSNWDARILAVERDGLGAIVDAVMARWFTERTRTERPELVRGFSNMLLRTPPAGYTAGCRAVRDADLRADDARIAAPTLVVVGSHDESTTPEMGAELRAAIPGAELAVVHAAHIVCAEQPVAFNQTLTKFLGAG